MKKVVPAEVDPSCTPMIFKNAMLANEKQRRALSLLRDDAIASILENKTSKFSASSEVAYAFKLVVHGLIVAAAGAEVPPECEKMPLDLHVDRWTGSNVYLYCKYSSAQKLIDDVKYASEVLDLQEMVELISMITRTIDDCLRRATKQSLNVHVEASAAQIAVHLPMYEHAKKMLLLSAQIVSVAPNGKLKGPRPQLAQKGVAKAAVAVPNKGGAKGTEGSRGPAGYLRWIGGNVDSTVVCKHDQASPGSCTEPCAFLHEHPRSTKGGRMVHEKKKK